VADAIFEQRRLAEIYDPLDPNRSDLEVYAALVEAFGARTVLDIGCGTAVRVKSNETQVSTVS
jgi:hypothetical protein